MNLDIYLQIDEKDISLSALAKLILRLNAASADSPETAAMGTHSTPAESAKSATEQVAETATEQVAETAAMGTHSTPAESAKSATEQVAESAAMGTHSTPAESAKSATMGTHSTVPESAKTATEQVAESTPVPENTFTMFADPEPDADKMSAIREKLRAIAKNGRRDEAKALMLKYRVPALSKLDSLTDEELSRMYDEVMAL